MIDSIRVSGVSYAVNYKSSTEMGSRLGLADFNGQEISINRDSTAQTKKIALWHETLHILSHAYGIDLSEAQVQMLTHAIVALTEDNFGIVEQFKECQ